MTRFATAGLPIQGYSNNQHKTENGSSIYSEHAKTDQPSSPTPSWRKPDPSQWRYGSRHQSGH